MEQSQDTVSLDIDESNELLFKVNVEGSSNSPAKVRLVVESNDVSYMFAGHPVSDPGHVQFVIPNMSGKLKEGQYSSRVEVLIENKYFAPVNFGIEFKKTTSVVAEMVQVPKPTIDSSPKLTVSASPVIVKKTVVSEGPRPLAIEAPREAQNVPQEDKVVAPTKMGKRSLKERWEKKQQAPAPSRKPSTTNEVTVSESEVRAIIHSLIGEKKRK